MKELKPRYTVKSYDTNLGTYRADSPLQAVKVMLEDAGYKAIIKQLRGGEIVVGTDAPAFNSRYFVNGEYTVEVVEIDS